MKEGNDDDDTTIIIRKTRGDVDGRKIGERQCQRIKMLPKLHLPGILPIEEEILKRKRKRICKDKDNRVTSAISSDVTKRQQQQRDDATASHQSTSRLHHQREETISTRIFHPQRKILGEGTIGSRITIKSTKSGIEIE